MRVCGPSNFGPAKLQQFYYLAEPHMSLVFLPVPELGLFVSVSGLLIEREKKCLREITFN